MVVDFKTTFYSDTILANRKAFQGDGSHAIESKREGRSNKTYKTKPIKMAG